MGIKSASQIISKPVLDLASETEVGYVLDLCFDKPLTKLLGILVADEESEQENFLPLSSIRVFGSDCLFSDGYADSQFGGLMPSHNPIGKAVYDQKGNRIGKVRDVCILGGRVKLLLDSCEIFSSQICIFGQNYLIFGKKTLKCNKKSQILPASSSIKVEVQSSPVKIGGSQTVSAPVRVTLTPKSLLNKTSSQDIFGLNNEVIAKRGQQITQKIIDKAKKHGKLNLLIIYAK